jgi:hypothetical protein
MPTEMELLEQISGNQKKAIDEAKEVKAVAEAANREVIELKAQLEKKTEELTKLGATIGEIQAEQKELKAKSGRMGGGSQSKVMTLASLLKEVVDENKEKFFASAESKAFEPISISTKDKTIIEQKAVGNIASANLSGTGNNYVSYLDWRPGMEPLGQFHFRDIFRTINSETDFVRFPRANTPIGEGSFARVAEGTQKPQIDRDYTMIDLTLTPMAGYAIVSRQALRNIVFLRDWLPTSMMEQLTDAEDYDFANKLVAAATGSVSTTGFTNSTTAIDKLIIYLTRNMQAKYRPNFIAGDATVWGNLIANKETNAGYSTPGILSVTTDGTVRLLGIPFYPVNWLTGGRILTGDSTKAAIVQSEGLTMRQTDSHASTFITNEVTFLLERTSNLAIFRPDAFTTAVIS